jgi:deoxyadenosine/deoxycytidine kinase
MRIEICGGIGAGKTTLTTLLGLNGYSSIFEDFKSNPFWEPFFSNPDKFNFETEITFLLQHYHEIKLALDKVKTFVCDFSFYQDLAYAKKGLNESRLKIFEDIFNEGIKELGQPDLLICLKCDEKTLLHRIRSRGRKEEKLIDLNFLAKLNQNIYTEVQNLDRYNKVLYLDSKRYNFVLNTYDQQEVLNLVQNNFQ